jgi:hypothetical protein
MKNYWKKKGLKPNFRIWKNKAEPVNKFNTPYIHTSLLLGGDVGSPVGGDRLGGLSSLLSGSAGATFT